MFGDRTAWMSSPISVLLLGWICRYGVGVGVGRDGVGFWWGSLPSYNFISFVLFNPSTPIQLARLFISFISPAWFISFIEICVCDLLSVCRRTYTLDLKLESLLYIQCSTPNTQHPAEYGEHCSIFLRTASFVAVSGCWKDGYLGIRFSLLLLECYDIASTTTPEITTVQLWHAPNREELGDQNNL